MSHLSPERLAALVDDAPTSTELAHLVACIECSRERASYSALTALTKSAPTLDVPLTTWAQIAPSLRKHGVIAGRPRSIMYRTARTSMRIAAGVTLIAGGMAAGRVSAGARPVPVSLAELRGPTATFASIEAAEQARINAEMQWDAASKYLATVATPAHARLSRDEVQRRMSLQAISRTARSFATQDPTFGRIADIATSEYVARFQPTVSQTLY